MDSHPAAHLFPLLEGPEFDALVADIRVNGLLEPIVTHEGLVLDGRNRLRACEAAEVKPRFRKWAGEGGSTTRFVIAMNIQRRHLTVGQSATVAVEALPMLQAEAAERKAETSRATAAAQARTADGTFAAPCERNVAPTRQPEPAPEARKAAAEAAALFGVSARNVEYAAALAAADHDLFAQVRAGDVTLSRATREVKKAETAERLEAIAAQQPDPLTGTFDVIVVDPPWPIAKIDRDCRPNQVALDYPTMTLDAIKAMTLPASPDCHVWLWTTQRFLPAAFDVLGAWKLGYVCAFVWHKPGGFQPVGLPQYNAEFALYARKGKPAFTATDAFPTCFTARRGKHSEKPAEFYATVRRVTAGRRLDMFSRRKIEGFLSWGNQAALAAV